MEPADAVTVIVGKFMMKIMITLAIGQDGAEPVVLSAGRGIVGSRAERVRE